MFIYKHKGFPSVYVAKFRDVEYYGASFYGALSNALRHNFILK